MTQQQDLERLVSAYNRMITEVKTQLDQHSEALPRLEDLIETARQQEAQRGELSPPQIDKVSQYLTRDLRGLAEYTRKPDSDYRGWFHIDLELIEARLVDLFTSVADKTTVELAALREQAAEHSFYHTGEVMGPGALQCVNCTERLSFTQAGHIPPCPKCHGTDFVRVSGRSYPQSA